MKITTWLGSFWVGWLFLASVASAAEPDASDSREHATAAMRAYLERRVARLNQREPANAATLAEWQSHRPILRRQLLDMLGLWPVPARGDLQATITGQVESQGIIVEKLHFQSLPGLYVTANFYRHRDATGKVPTILYLNGHGRVVQDGVSFGNKVHYQPHPLWFAQNGYNCLTIDTLQLGEIEGDHHGTYKLDQWWWICRGYTPAGVEAWNSIRALDYLETRPEVDMQKIGVTGRSGGGAYTWWLAALDDRPACLVPVAGITDLEDHVVHDCVEGHCDCMYHINRLGWDFSTIACLAAPRPCLLANSDKDSIFPLGGVTRIHEKLRHTYGLFGAADKLGIFISEGPHSDTQELQVAAFRWMNRWLKGTQHPVAAFGERYFAPAELKVFAELPGDQRNTQLQESFVPAAPSATPPATLAAWQSERERLLAALRTQSFSGITHVGSLAAQVLDDRSSGGTRLRTIVFSSDEELRVPMFVLTADGDAPIEQLRVEVVDDAGFQAWGASLGGDFAKNLAHFGLAVAGDRVPPPAVRAVPAGAALVVVTPRGWGPMAWANDKKSQTHMPRRFVLTGTTVDEGRIFDVRRAIEAARELLAPEARIELAGRGPAAGIALYAALFEPGVDSVELADLAVSHREGPVLIGVLRVLDVPQALALLFPRRVSLTTDQPGAWTWTDDVARLHGEPSPFALNVAPPGQK
ncbi:MAG: acetylxylan esterase [Planctomycetaceae bacterium]|nr:acetylxylan esterase [Planctomycetaceae bacterium]